jgi:hypothetical protein
MREIDSSRGQLLECERSLELLRHDAAAEKARAEGLAGDLAFSKKAAAKTQAELAATKDILAKVELGHRPKANKHVVVSSTQT